jgi:hypothetical protein
MHILLTILITLAITWAIGYVAAWAVLTRVEDDKDDPTVPSNRALAILWPVTLAGAIADIISHEPAIVERLTMDSWAVDQDVHDITEAAKATGWTEEQLRALHVGDSCKVADPPRTHVPKGYADIACPKCGKRDFTLFAQKCRAVCHACGNEWVA